MSAKCTVAAVVLALTLGACLSASAIMVTGTVTQVKGELIVAQFPVPVMNRSMLTILANDRESVAGVAVVEGCSGGNPPYTVSANLYVPMDSASIVAGKKAYVNSVNTRPVPSVVPAQPAEAPLRLHEDLKLYYFADGQKAGYGPVGLGYQRSIPLSRSTGIELDGGITGLGNINDEDAGSVDTEYWMKALNGRLLFDVTRDLGLYSGYRWSKTQAGSDGWQDIISDLSTKTFSDTSDEDAGILEARGIEYGLTLRPAGRFGISAGYIPSYRVDYGSLGVRTEPGYTAEIRIGMGSGAARLRGLYSDGNWLGDLGITLR